MKPVCMLFFAFCATVTLFSCGNPIELARQNCGNEALCSEGEICTVNNDCGGNLLGKATFCDALPAECASANDPCDCLATLDPDEDRGNFRESLMIQAAASCLTAEDEGSNSVIELSVTCG